jgi:hypothetical protein
MQGMHIGECGVVEAAPSQAGRRCSAAVCTEEHGGWGPSIVQHDGDAVARQGMHISEQRPRQLKGQLLFP